MPSNRCVGIFPLAAIRRMEMPNRPDRRGMRIALSPPTVCQLKYE
jgi:hypothetical protein